ncbi:MAG: hypothetical protein PUB37_08350, partial [Firmicutes bacterium]|nr:hypothetical protein [Bacillota bacterium]
AETLTQANAPDEQTFRREMERNYRKNLDGYKQALASFRLKKLMWDCGCRHAYGLDKAGLGCVGQYGFA